MRQAKASSIILALLALGSFVLKVIFNALGGIGCYPFSRSVANVSDTFPLDVTPAGWAFSIWGLIYTWNLAYIAYALTTEFRDVPPVINELFYLLYIICDVLNIAWLYAFTSEYIFSSCVILVSNQIALYALMYVVYVNYSAYQKEIEQQHKADAICTAVLVENGIMLNAAWVTIASLLSIGMVLTYDNNVPMGTSCVLILAALLVIVLLWFVLQNFTFQPYLNYTYSDWPVFLWALSASLAKNWDPSSVSARFTMADLVIVIILVIARIALQAQKNKKVKYFDKPLLNEKFIQLSV